MEAEIAVAAAVLGVQYGRCGVDRARAAIAVPAAGQREILVVLVASRIEIQPVGNGISAGAHAQFLHTALGGAVRGAERGIQSGDIADAMGGGVGRQRHRRRYAQQTQLQEQMQFHGGPRGIRVAYEKRRGPPKRTENHKRIVRTDLGAFIRRFRVPGRIALGIAVILGKAPQCFWLFCQLRDLCTLPRAYV